MDPTQRKQTLQRYRQRGIISQAEARELFYLEHASAARIVLLAAVLTLAVMLFGALAHG
jgi:hypothetical protein